MYIYIYIYICVYIYIYICIYIYILIMLACVVVPPSSVVKCVYEVFVWGLGVLFVSDVCVFKYVCQGCADT